MAGLQLGIFLLAGSVLLLEIALTRVFAIMLWHHLAYMVIAIAMLGFGAAASLLTWRGTRPQPGIPAQALTILAIGFGVTVLLSLFLAARIPVDTLAIWKELPNLLNLGLLYAVVFVPFLLAGGAIGLALSRLAAYVNRLYFFDLLGSAVGGAGSLWLLGHFGASATVGVAASLGLLSGACFAAAGDRALRRFAVLPGALALAVAAASTGALERVGMPQLAIEIPYAAGKEFARLVGPGQSIRLYSPTAEVEVGPSIRQTAMIGGDFGSADDRKVTARLVGQDGTAPTMLFENASDLGAFPFLDDSQTGAVYVARAAAGGKAPDVLVIGVGGGVDVMIALAHGAGSVTAVEVNSGMIEMVTRRFDDYLGGLFRPGAHPLSDRIRLVHGEGRSFVRSGSERWDVIQLSGVDSFTALNTGAYTLSESYLYTAEAVTDLYARLNEGGVLSFSRFIMKHPRKPRETLRLAHIAATALRQLRVEDPAAQIVVFQGLGWASTLVKRGAFTERELAALRIFARREGFWGLVFDPLHSLGSPFEPSPRYDARAREGTERSLASASIPGLDGAAVQTEDVHRAYRLLRQGRRDESEAALEAAVAGASPDLRSAANRQAAKLVTMQADRSAEADVGFHQTRADFSTLLRGSERERAAFLAGYEYDLSPASDDAPFFFNYYRYRGLLRAENPDRKHWKSAYNPDYPIGHGVLLASLVQITLLAALLILVPLRRLSRQGVSTTGRWRVFVYFAALGSGFMFVEISLMQKLVLFLGHPTYAVSVVLTALLAAAGVGSLLSGRIGRPGPGALRALLVALPMLVLALAAAVDLLLPLLLGLSFAVRVAVVVLLMFPLGVGLGLPFPLGIRLLETRAPNLVPWAWGINAFLSVFSSIFCIVLAMAIGFAKVLVLGALIYALGFSALISFESDTLGEAGS
jgi:hypothetical protein